MKNINTKKIIIASVFLAMVLILSGCGCKKSNPHLYSLNLEIWGPLDYGTALRESFNNYKMLNPNVSAIIYKKIPIETYQKELIDALAAGQGPDIFLINNAWLPAFKDKVAPAPKGVDPKIINEQKFENNFVDVAVNDFIDQGEVYAVPLSVDSLALYYNKDLFNQVGIATPPETWNEFIFDVKKLTNIDSFGNIIQSGAAIGTVYNINKPTDILSLIMLQNGTEMVDKNGKAIFDRAISSTDLKGVYPGEEALKIYTQFADSRSPYYTWNPRLHYSIDAFSEGTVAMMINYSWNIDTVSSKSPKLNFAIAPIPQFENKPAVNFADYFGFSVAKNRISQTQPNTPTVRNDTRVKEAWMLLTYLSTKPDGIFGSASSSGGVGKKADPNFDPAENILSKTKQPAARRDLIELQKTDVNIGIFAKGNLIAKSFKQKDALEVEFIFSEMIDSVNKGQTVVSDAIKTAAQRVNNL